MEEDFFLSGCNVTSQLSFHTEAVIILVFISDPRVADGRPSLIGGDTSTRSLDTSTALEDSEVAFLLFRWVTPVCASVFKFMNSFFSILPIEYSQTILCVSQPTFQF